ncbi:MAG: hypothetical protein R3E54_03500 [Halioglobus sp.]
MSRFFGQVCLGTAFFIIATVTQALPMLTPDGSSIKGLDVGGEIYNIYFGDGIVGDTYDASVVNTPEWNELANDISVAVREAFFRDLALSNSGTLLNGCLEPSLCIAMLPDAFDVDTSVFSDGGVNSDGLNIAFYYPEESPAEPAVPVTLSASVDTHQRSVITLMTFERVETSAVPIPSSLALLLIAGMISIALSTQRIRAVFTFMSR